MMQSLKSVYCSNDESFQWAELQRHTVVSLCVCVRVCVTLQLGFLEARDKLSADTCNIGTMQLYLKAKCLWFFIYKALFSSYSMICLPWCPLREIQSWVKTNLFIVASFSTGQSHLCHRPGSNTSENTKMRPSKASCHLPVHHSVMQNCRETSYSLACLGNCSVEGSRPPSSQDFLTCSLGLPWNHETANSFLSRTIPRPCKEW